MINSELPKVDVTYGTKRTGIRSYRSATIFFSSIAKSNNKSIEVVNLNGETFVSNPIKVSARSHVLVFYDRRIRLDEVESMSLIERRDIQKCESSVGEFKKPNQSNLKTFNLILKKSHATKKSVAVFLSSGKIYKGVSINCDYDSVQIRTNSGDVVIMYNAVNRIVPLENDGSLAE